MFDGHNTKYTDSEDSVHLQSCYQIQHVVNFRSCGRKGRNSEVAGKAKFEEF